MGGDGRAEECGGGAGQTSRFPWTAMDVWVSLGDSEWIGIGGLEEEISMRRKCRGAHGENFS